MKDQKQPARARNRVYLLADDTGFLARSSFAALAAAVLFVSSIEDADAKARCRSEAYEKQDAIEYCAGVLNCPEEDVNCRGRARRWICTCETDDSASDGDGFGFHFEFNFPLGDDRDGHHDGNGSGGLFEWD